MMTADLSASPPDIMTIEDVSAFLRIPVSSVYKLAQERKIPAQKVGRHWRFHRPTLVRWIAGAPQPTDDAALAAE